MAAGLGFKDFTTGEVLTAADVDGYLMQGIWVFASTAARDAAVTAPAEGNFAFTKDTNSLWYYDGAAWVASGATGDIEGVTAGTGISGGGTSGTVTITNSMATAIDAKGDLIVGTGADAFSRLAVGTNGQVLTADSAQATGLKFATPSGGLTLITTGSFSGNSTSINDCFSATYENYLLMAETIIGTNNASDFAFRYRVSGADNTTSDYNLQYFDLNGGSLASGNSASNTNGRIGSLGTNSGTNGRFVAHIFNPFAAKQKAVYASGNRLGLSTAINAGMVWNGFPTTTSFTGITLYATTGAQTFTGTYYIYGLAN